jgi:hypothetical protein
MFPSQRARHHAAPCPLHDLGLFGLRRLLSFKSIDRCRESARGSVF